MSDERLLNCPFCGGEAKVQSFTHDHRVYCANCEAGTRKYFHTKEEAIKAWNTRKPMERIIERLEREYDLADQEKGRCMVENALQFESAKGYATGIDTAIEIVKGGGVDETG